jgi:DNA polymerase-3 subunit beta
VRIRADRDDLADVFSRANRGVGVRSALPILQGVLCEVAGNTLSVTGTDLEVTIRTTAEVEVMDEGRFVVPGRLITEAVRKMPQGAVTLGSVDGEIEIVGKGPRFSLRELATEDFPELTDPDLSNATSIDGDQLASAIAGCGETHPHGSAVRRW